MSDGLKCVLLEEKKKLVGLVDGLDLDEVCKVDLNASAAGTFLLICSPRGISYSVSILILFKRQMKQENN